MAGLTYWLAKSSQNHHNASDKVNKHGMYSDIAMWLHSNHQSLQKYDIHV